MFLRLSKKGLARVHPGSGILHYVQFSGDMEFVLWPNSRQFGSYREGWRGAVRGSAPVKEDGQRRQAQGCARPLWKTHSPSGSLIASYEIKQLNGAFFQESKIRLT